MRMPDPEYETIIATVQDSTCVITLNRPNRMNAYTTQMGYELGDALARADADDAVRAVVITGAGSAFCAGADLTPGGNTFTGDISNDLTPPSGWTGPTIPDAQMMAPYEVRKPVIAAINGHAVGVGLTLTMLCDVRYASVTAKLGFPFLARGIIPDLMSHWTVPRIVGLSRAAELFFTARTFSGLEAQEMGLVNKAFAPAEVLPAAVKLAAEIAQNAAPASIALCKGLLWDSLELPLEASRVRERELLNRVASLPDAVEGVESFLAKRPPRWKVHLNEAPAND